eukprot:gb/GECH01011054.1/.p1 GENE.gb/GECH01011054.1/~~gb/GECH01011054.1/.p1  ORF type:complete len:398 (+),score=-43.48 gb/GECH01011054.1/:1-1194(+)
MSAKKISKRLGVYRWTYNQCVHRYNKVWSKEGLSLKKKNRKLTQKALRNRYANKKSDKLKGKEWVFEVNYNCRGEAIREFLAAKSIARKVYLQKKEKSTTAVKPFRMHFKSKKRKLQESFYVPSRDWNNSSPSFSWIKKIRSREPLPRRLDYDTRVVKDSSSRFFLLVPQVLCREEQCVESFNQDQVAPHVASMDPGVRTFLTLYDNYGHLIEFGKYDIGRIFRFAQHADKLQSKIYKKLPHDKTTFAYNHKKRYNMRRAYRRMQNRLRDMVRDCHHKVAKFLCQNYHCILLPKFETQGMVKKGHRKIGSKTVRQMIRWSHYRFQQRLLAKARSYGVLVIICDEAYTSKTCSQCGHIDHNLGGAKEYRCGQCHCVFDRDANGARNIFLKYLIEHIHQ